MRARYKYGIPAAAGLATAGYAASQGEDPGSIGLAGLAGGAGAAAGLLGARQFAGRYSPTMLQAVQNRVINPLSEAVLTAQTKLTDNSTLRKDILNTLANKLSDAQRTTPTPEIQRFIGKGVAGLGVPLSASIAGLGGVALGAIPGAMNIPGFQQQTVDPESYGSSNSLGARYKQTTGTAGISNY
jgi:uncharacterized coiled-coil protein SlyX